MRMLLASLVLGALVCGPALPARVAACPPVTGTAAKKYAWVELRGTLQVVELFTNRPVDVIDIWLEAGGERHSLRFQNMKDRLRAARLAGKRVGGRGWQGHDGHVLVTGLDPTPDRVKVRGVKI